MKKPIRFIVMAVAVSLSATLLLMVGCKKREAPSCPYSASATRSANTIRLSWTSVENADFYVITDGHGFYLDEIYGTSYTDYYPSEGNNYYRVYSENQYGRSSSYASASCYYEGDGGGSGGGSGTAPSAPTGVSAEVSGSKIYVTWNSVSNASYYKVYRASNSSGSYSTIESSTSNTYYYDASPNTYNYYKVTAVNSSGTESEKSDYAYCYYSNGGGGSAPSAPTGVSAEVSGSKIYVSWNSVSNANQYNIYWSNSSSSGYEQIATTSNTYYYDNYPAEYNYYKIKAVNSYGTSSYSSYAYCHYSSGGGGTVYSPCPVHYTSHTATSSTITLKWSNPTTSGCGTPTTAYLRVKQPDTYDYVTLQTLSGSATSASFNYLQWVNSDGYVYCGIITENSAGTSGGLPMVYDVTTGTWYGGNGLELTEEMGKEWYNFSSTNR